MIGSTSCVKKSGRDEQKFKHLIKKYKKMIFFSVQIRKLFSLFAVSVGCLHHTLVQLDSSFSNVGFSLPYQFTFVFNIFDIR